MAKTVVKVKSAPKAAKVTVKAKAITEAYGDQRFFVINGQILSRISELTVALQNMDADTYAYHVTSDKNDFSQWVSEVLGEKALATKLKGAKSKSAMLNVLAKI